MKYQTLLSQKNIRVSSTAIVAGVLMINIIVFLKSEGKKNLYMYIGILLSKLQVTRAQLFKASLA